MECRAYGICLDSQSRGYLGKDRKVSSAAGGNLSRMHKTQETAKESRLNFMYSHLRNRTLGRVDFSNLFIVLNGQQVASLKEASDKGVPVFAYGIFINSVIEFLIIAFCLFLVIKQVNRFKRPVAPGPAGFFFKDAAPTEIRDLLKTGPRP